MVLPPPFPLYCVHFERAVYTLCLGCGLWTAGLPNARGPFGLCRRNGRRRRSRSAGRAQKDYVTHLLGSSARGGAAAAAGARNCKMQESHTNEKAGAARVCDLTPGRTQDCLRLGRARPSRAALLCNMQITSNNDRAGSSRARVRLGGLNVGLPPNPESSQAAPLPVFVHNLLHSVDWGSQTGHAPPICPLCAAALKCAARPLRSVMFDFCTS